MTVKINSIIFDIGGVLDSFHLKKFYQELKEYGQISNYDIFKRFFYQNMRELNLGKISRIKFICLVIKKFDLNISSEEFQERFDRSVEINYELLDFLKEIYKNKHNRYSLYILSNNSNLFKKSLKEIRDYNIFKNIVISSEIHIKKPDKKCYDYIIQKNNLIPQNCLFIDDKLTNLIPAKKLGMKVFEFKSTFQLISFIKSL